jgi:pyruvate formate lyase activating enzyme
MKYSAYIKFSMIDYPGKHCAIVFAQGCNLRCPFCHNPSLVLPHQFTKLLPDEELFSFLTTRIGKLDAVSITGGEPLLQPDIIQFCQRIKEMGFLVKIDTNGTNPEKLKALLESRSIDYIAMDIKASEDSFTLASGGYDCYNEMLESMQLLRISGLDYEFRTTLVAGIHSVEDISKCLALMQPGERYFLQQFQPAETLNPDYQSATGFSDQEIKQLLVIAQNLGLNLTIR